MYLIVAVVAIVVEKDYKQRGGQGGGAVITTKQHDTRMAFDFCLSPGMPKMYGK